MKVQEAIHNSSAAGLRLRERQYLGATMLALVAAFVISPLAGTLITLFFAWFFNSWKLAKFSTVVLFLFLWCVQSTRTFSVGELGDFPWYMTLFQSLEKMPLWKLIFFPSTTTAITPGNTTVEYGWQVFNRIGYSVFGDNFFHFAYCTIATSYLLIFSAIYKYTKSIGANVRYYICAISFLAFLSPYFSICNNLFRQQTAMSLVIFALVDKVVNNKFRWYLLLIATSFHTMCIAFLPFFFVKLYKKPTLRFITLTIVFFVIVLFTVRRLDMLSIINIGIVQKLATASEYTGTDVMETAAAIKYFAIVALMYVNVVFLQKKVHPNTIAMMNITMIMALLYIVLEPLPLIQTRYYITRFMFLPFIIPYFFNKNNFVGDMYTLCVIGLFIMLFFNADYEHFKFSFDDLLSNTLFHYDLI